MKLTASVQTPDAVHLEASRLHDAFEHLHASLEHAEENRYQEELLKICRLLEEGDQVETGTGASIEAILGAWDGGVGPASAGGFIDVHKTLETAWALDQAELLDFRCNILDVVSVSTSL